MKLLVSSHAFAPSYGGLETVSRLLAQEFCRLGHEVRLITQTPGKTREAFSFPVTRQASAAQLIELTRWCDLSWHNNLSVRTIWPAFVLRKPVVITHQGSYALRPPRGLDFNLRLKHAIVSCGQSVAISQAVAHAFKSRSVVIPNPYDPAVFMIPRAVSKRAGLAFVGRLVQEKGVDVLLEALAVLRARGVTPCLTIIGGGPLLEEMRELARRLALQDQVTFAGARNPPEIAALLQQHRILVVPSRYDEPFGVVALEGIACGCVVIGTRGGGLPEAIGPGGMTVENGNVQQLADAIEKLLTHPVLYDSLAADASKHLAQFHPIAVAERYLALFEQMLAQ